jgi:hypothetical protein
VSYLCTVRQRRKRRSVSERGILYS